MTVVPDDLAAFIGQPLDDVRAQLMIDLAVKAAAPYFSGTLPEAADGTILSAAARGYSAPVPSTSQATGPYLVSGQAGGLYLNKRERADLRRLAGGGGSFSIDPLNADAGTGLPPWDSAGSDVTVATS